MADDRADGLVLFGATGDLAAKKLYPALYHLERAGRLGPVIGVSSSDWTDDDLRTRVRESVTARVEGVDGAALDRLCARCSYLPGDYRQAGTFDGLAGRVADAGVERPLFFLAIPPVMLTTWSTACTGWACTSGVGWWWRSPSAGTGPRPGS